MLVVIGQFSARHILLHVRPSKISGIFDTMAKISRGLPSSVLLSAMANKFLELTQIRQEDR